MPKFKVRYHFIEETIWEIEIEAPDGDAAEDAAREMVWYSDLGDWQSDPRIAEVGYYNGDSYMEVPVQVG